MCQFRKISICIKIKYFHLDFRLERGSSLCAEILSQAVVWHLRIRRNGFDLVQMLIFARGWQTRRLTVLLANAIISVITPVSGGHHRGKGHGQYSHWPFR